MAAQRIASYIRSFQQTLSCHFPAQCPRCASSKYTCAHSCVHGRIGLKMRCNQAYCWRFHHRRITKPVLKSKTQPYFNWGIIWIVRCTNIGGFTTPRLPSVVLNCTNVAAEKTKLKPWQCRGNSQEKTN